MPLLLYRVDDRLIHGQVVVGWGRPLGIEFIVLVDDQVRASEWEQDLYRMGVPSGVEVRFASVPEAVATLPAWQQDQRRGLLLTADIESMLALRQAHGSVEPINLGGVHHRPGRTERLPYLYLSDQELERLQSVSRAGATITAQDVPTAPAVNVKGLG
jgi:PTS system mannose-specific IIB component/fructoselysine and glucoselysine-specific PTS system IIB component